MTRYGIVVEAWSENVLRAIKDDIAVEALVPGRQRGLVTSDVELDRR